jgi:hypothetical protein
MGEKVAGRWQVEKKGRAGTMKASTSFNKGNNLQLSFLIRFGTNKQKGSSFHSDH